MNYIDQINGFWVAQDAYSFQSDDIALYFYLLNTCNKLRWMNPFKRNNSKIMSDLGIKDRRTLERQRNTLKQYGIIDFKTKNGDANVAYEMADLSIFCTGFCIGGSSGERLGNGIGNSSGECLDNINKTKRKHKPNNSASNEAGAAEIQEPKKKVEEEKKVAPKKEEEQPPKEPTVWEVCVKVWFDFYKTLKGAEPTFTGESSASLKKIVENLEKRATKKNWDWNSDTAKNALTHFLTYAIQDKWLLENFLLKNLNSQFDKIISNGQASKQTQYADLERELAATISGTANQ